jgi:hypothetical protein
VNISLKVDVLERPEATLYGQLFKECPDSLAQQSLQWADIISPISPDKPYFLIVRNQDNQIILGGIPLYHFKGKLGGVLTSVPHAGPLGGCVCRQDLDNTLCRYVYKVLLEKAIGLAKELQCISLSIITNPFLQDAGLYNEPVPPNYIFNNFSQVIDLNRVFSASGRYNTGKARYNNHIYKNLAKAKSANITVQWGEEHDFDSWYKIHCKRHGELGKIPLPRSLLQGIITFMRPAGIGGLAVIRMEEKVIGGCFYIWNKNIVDAFIMSGDSDYFEYGINHVVTDYALRYFRGRGLTWFNWQSSKRSSGVYTFKERWGSQERNYQFLTWTFPGFKKIFNVGVETVSKYYQWHYVAPFEAIKKKLTHGVFDKI